MKSTGARNTIAKVAKGCVAAGLIVWLVQQDYLNFSALRLILAPEFLVPCVVLLGLNVALCHWRWVLILNARDFDKRFLDTLPLTFIGMFFNFVVPGGIGGDLIKGYYVLQDHPSRRTEAATSILLDRIIGLYAMLTLGLVTLLLNWDLARDNTALASTGFMLGGAFIAGSAGLALAFSRRVRHWSNRVSAFDRLPGGALIAKILGAVQDYRERTPVLAAAFALSLLAQVFSVLFMIIVGRALGSEAPLAAYFFSVPVGFIVSAIPIAPAGIGVGQMAFFFLFNVYTGQKSELGPSVITAFQVLQFCFGLLGAFFYLQRKRPVLSEVAE